jgi:uncharacterized OsmC-like protein
MSLHEVATALQRATRVFERRPEMGLHDDSPATARWTRATRIVASHANGTELQTDMPTEFGGTGDRITPGWLFRAGIASCAVTSIAMRAAAEGIELTTLEAVVTSRSDSRGLIGVRDANGDPVFAGPGDMKLNVRIGGHGVSDEQLRELVARGCNCSPIPSAVANATPLDVRVEIAAG